MQGAGHITVSTKNKIGSYGNTGPPEGNEPLPPRFSFPKCLINLAQRRTVFYNLYPQTSQLAGAYELS